MAMDEGTSRVVAVTGAAGFLGRRVVRLLAERGRHVRAIVRRAPRPGLLDYEGVRVAEADIRDRDAMRAALEGAGALVHAAAILRERGGATYATVNERACEVVYAAAGAAGVKRAVHVSVVGASDDARAAYSASRWRGEQIALASGVPPAVLRFSALFGDGDEFMNPIAALVRLGPVVPVIGSGKTLFQPLGVDDAAEAVVRALDGSVDAGRVAELGGPQAMSYEQIVDAVAEAMGRRIVKVRVPIAMFRPAVWAMERLMPASPVTSSQLQMLQIDNVPQGLSFEAVFGFAPRPLAGNIDYVRRVGHREALQITLGRPPAHIRDH